MTPTVALSANDDTVVISETISPSDKPLLNVSESWRYELQEEIGRGGMGIVYRARQVGLDRPVAIKMILAGQLATAEQIEILRAEARAAAKVRHANIVGVYESGQVKGWHYIAMELVEGTSLAHARASAPMDPMDVVRLLLPVVRAVAHLHDHGILHQDLKPANILVDSSGTPYVTDFGLARAFVHDQEQIRSQGRVMGTPSYMAPEQASGRHADVSIASDVYGLGAVIYDLLAGHPPFHAATPAETLMQVVRQDPVPLQRLRKDVPAELESICLTCLSKNPRKRYPSAHLLARDLKRFLQGDPVDARPLRLFQRTSRWMRREPALALRWVATSLLFGIEQIWYQLGVTSSSFHGVVMGIAPAMALVSFVLNRLARRARWSQVARMAWAGVDVAFLTVLLLFSPQSIFGAMFVFYPIYIAASGLWYRPRLVMAALLFSLLSYLSLLLEARWVRPDIVPTFDVPFVHMTGLTLLALIVYFMVVRVRILASCFRTG